MAKKFEFTSSKELLRNISDEVHSDKDIVEIPLKNLVEDEENDKTYNMDDLDGLTDSIKQYGVREPLIVWAMPDSEKYLVCAGHRRKRASENAGKKTAPCIIKPWEPDKNSRTLQALDDNMTSRSEKPVERGRVIERYVAALKEQNPEKGMVEIKREVQKRYSISVTTINRLIALTTIIPELQEKANDESNYAYAEISKAAQLTAEEQKAFNDKIDQYTDAYGNEKLTRDMYVPILKQVTGEVEVEQEIKDAEEVVKEIEEEHEELIANEEIPSEEVEEVTTKLEMANLELADSKKKKAKKFLRDIKNSSGQLLIKLTDLKHLEDNDLKAAIESLEEVNVAIEMALAEYK
ncbi:ParB/RepB/Spo0J family partition protein [Lachnospiraceae bacterium PF1-22]